MKKRTKTIAIFIALAGLVAICALLLAGMDEEGGIPAVNSERMSSFLGGAHEDSVFGEPFVVIPMDLENRRATLVEYPYGASQSVNVLPDSSRLDTSVMPRGIILYVHGYNDYFFNDEIAKKADSAGYAFFAIDLHGYGRSTQSDSLRCDMSDISEYYEELDYAMELAQLVVKKRATEKLKVSDAKLENLLGSRQRVPEILIGHSLGGLIASLYASHRPNLNALVLNSPFLEMSFGFLTRKLALPLLASLGKYFPNVSLGTTGNPNYAYSLLKEEKGEWVYNKEWKSMDRPTTFLHWLRAVHKGQNKVREGLNLKMPILAMHSDCSVNDDEWTDEYLHCDGVLDVELMDAAAAKLGVNVKNLMVQGGLHDLYLSRKDARDAAYKATFEFIDSCVHKTK